MKNIDFVNNIIANKLNIDESIVKKVNKYYWNKGVKKKLSTLSDPAIFIKGFATIGVSRYNLRKQIIKIIWNIRGTKRSVKYKETTKEIFLAKLYEKLKRLLVQRNELAKQYYKNERTWRIPESDTINNKESGEDNRGDS